MICFLNIFISIYLLLQLSESLCFASLANFEHLKNATTTHKNNETNDKFYRKVAFLMYTEMVNFTPQN